MFVLERTGSGAWVAAAGVVRLLPYVAFGTIGGMIADWKPRRRTMITSDVIRAGVMLALAVVASRGGSPFVAIVLAAVATTFSVAYGPCVNASIPSLVSEDDLSVVNTLSTTVTNLSYALRPALGGVLLLLGSPTASFVVNGVTFLASALLRAGSAPIWGCARASSRTDRSRRRRSGASSSTASTRSRRRRSCSPWS